MSRTLSYWVLGGGGAEEESSSEELEMTYEHDRASLPCNRV